MISNSEVTVDFVSRGESPDEYRMTLIELGPWEHEQVAEQLLRVQDRLYGCIEAALEGRLAEKFPDSFGKKIVIELDAYDMEGDDLPSLFDAFANGIFEVDHYKQALENSVFVAGVSMKLRMLQT